MGLLTCALCAACLPNVAAAEGRIFGLVAKSVVDPNFQRAAAACQVEASRTGDACRLIGSTGPATPRLQARAIREALASGEYAALAISVTDSALIGAVVRDATIPVITFDSPFRAGDAPQVRAYVGTDNLAFGAMLARLAQRLRPTGGTLCLMSVARDPNLALRVLAVRRALSGQPDRPPGQPLRGERGWTEHPRCPWDSGDSSERALQQLATTLSSLRPDVFLAVGHWPVVDAAYQQVAERFAHVLEARRTVVVVGVGAVGAQFDEWLTRGWVHGFAAIDFGAIGGMVARALRAAADGDELPAVLDVPSLAALGHDGVCGVASDWRPGVVVSGGLH